MQLFASMGRRKFLSFSARIAAFFAVAPQPASKSSAGVVAAATPSDPVPLPSNLLRITFGVDDASPRPWDGELLGRDGNVEVSADHFRADDYTELITGSSPFPDTKKLKDVPFPSDFIRTQSSWICSTRRAPQHGATTEWNIRPEGAKPVIQSPSILLRQKTSARQPIQIKTPQGEFTVDSAQIQPFQPLSLLNG